MLKYTLVPKDFFSEETAREYLSGVVPVEESDPVEFLELPSYKAVLIYSGEAGAARTLADMVAAAPSISKYNKVLARVGDSVVDIIIAEGDKLLLCNTFPAPDPVTAQYFIFASLKQFQINPAVTTIYLFGDAPESLQNDLMRHFSSVDTI